MIRLAHIDDADELAYIAGNSFKDTYDGKVDSLDLDIYVSKTFTKNRMLENITDHLTQVYLILEESNLVGYVTLKTENPPHNIGSNPLNLSSIYLSKDVRGRGFGSKLMKFVMTYALENGYNAIYLFVWEKNDIAIEFYKKWMFTICGETKFEFVNAVHNDLIMCIDAEKMKLVL